MVGGIAIVFNAEPQLAAILKMSHSGLALTESLVKPLPRSNERILIMLSAEAILSRLTGVVAGELGDEAEMQPRFEVRYGVE